MNEPTLPRETASNRQQPDGAADEAWMARARQLHATAAARIDTVTLRRLRAASQAAAHPPPRRRLLPLLLPAGALATAALVLLLVGRPPHGQPPAASSGADVFAAATHGPEVEVAQDLDFYDWLASQPQPATGASVQ